jgi:putative SOS response-associated peptidase YedK
VKGLSTINARAETITKAPTRREPFKTRRCLVPAGFFLEWPKEGKPPKQPYAIELGTGSLFAFAGLWAAWKDKDGHWLQSFYIVKGLRRSAMCGIRARSNMTPKSSVGEYKQQSARRILISGPRD